MDFTQYEFQGKTYLDFKYPLEQMYNGKKDGLIKITPGHKDLTQWKAIREKWGETRISSGAPRASGALARSLPSGHRRRRRQSVQSIDSCNGIEILLNTHN